VLGIDVDDEPEEDDEEKEEDDESEDDEMDSAPVPQRSAASKAAAEAEAPSDDDDEEEDSDASIDPEDEVGGWGPHKRAYYNANNLDAIGSDEEMTEEERREMEVREARKLQAKLRQEMDDDDFGLAEAEMDLANEGTLSGSGKAARERRRAELDGGVASGSSAVQAS
jgi:U3 small nucleolar RNA-associated protein 3